jgi:ribonuclease III
VIDDYTPLLAALGHSFHRPELLTQALTHRSHVNETGEPHTQHNERLEFLGDAVVNLSVGHHLMETLPQAREGELSKHRAMVVNESGLARAAEELHLGLYLRLGRGEEQTGGRKKASILSDAFEAVIGAIFLDAGFEAADAAVRRLLGPLLAAGLDSDLNRDHKTRLQELVQAQRQTPPRYEVVEERGPEHAKTFTVAVFFGETLVAHADGHSKKAAEQRAAQRALAILERSGEVPGEGDPVE